MKCPVDGTDLAMTDRQGVEIDYCPKCRGVWLDRGELDKILERTSDVAVQQPSAPSYRPQQGHSHSDRHDSRSRKKKSLLGELFDF